MCLGIPGKVIELFEENGLKMGKIDYGGTVNKVCLEYLPEIRVGDYTIVHTGFGISILNEEEARKSLAVWEELMKADLDENSPGPGDPLLADDQKS
jgi:hydrogenase expression/formation protein HypC